MTDLRDALVALERLAAKIEQDAPGIVYKQDLAAAIREIAALHAIGLPGMVADADRYRWLRHKLTCGQLTADEELAIIGAKNPDELDAAIDAAIAAHSKGG